MLYKITNNLIAVDPKLYLTPQPSLGTRNNNPLQYQIISTRRVAAFTQKSIACTSFRQKLLLLP
jgi:hypothetical protein